MSSVVVLDTNIVSSLLDPEDAMHHAAVSAYQRHESAGAVFGISAVTWSESMVHALRRGDDGVRRLTALVAQITDNSYPVDTAIAESAARLRASELSLRLPDALIIATAKEQHDCILLTADKKLAKKAPDGLVELVTC